MTAPTPDDAARRAARRAQHPDDAARRAARRAFIRAQHPDAGGDPDTFVTGLAQLSADRVRPAAEPRTRAPRERTEQDLPRVRRSNRPDRLLARVVRSARRRWTGQPPRRLL